MPEIKLKAASSVKRQESINDRVDSTMEKLRNSYSAGRGDIPSYRVTELPSIQYMGALPRASEGFPFF